MTQFHSKFANVFSLCTHTFPQQILFQRYFSGRGLCQVNPFPKCSPENLVETECYARKEREKIKSFPFKNLLTNKSECCTYCSEFARFDDIYYKPSDPFNRAYFRTWNKCKPELTKMKTVCIMKQPEPQMRVKRRLHKCEVQQFCTNTNPLDFSDLMKCDKFNSPSCRRLKLHKCKYPRLPPRCFITVDPSDCKKKCTPYPSFSECIQPELKKTRRVECDCRTAMSLCHVFRMMKQGFTGYKY